MNFILLSFKNVLPTHCHLNSYVLKLYLISLSFSMPSKVCHSLTSSIKTPEKIVIEITVDVYEN